MKMNNKVSAFVTTSRPPKDSEAEYIIPFRQPQGEHIEGESASWGHTYEESAMLLSAMDESCTDPTIVLPIRLLIEEDFPQL